MLNNLKKTILILIGRVHIFGVLIVQKQKYIYFECTYVYNNQLNAPQSKDRAADSQ